MPGPLGIVITHVSESEVRTELVVDETLMVPNGFLHAGAVVSVAEPCSGYGCVANLSPGATGFTTIELKSSHLGTTRDGAILASAKPTHLGKTS